jgi:hypothetical protein
VGGSGLAFTSGNRQFVITASHVSQGDGGVTVELNGQQIKVIGRALSRTNDLELLEVTGIEPALIRASYDGNWIDYAVPADQRRRWIDAIDFVPLLDGINDPNLDSDNKFAPSRPSVLGMDFFSQLLHGPALIQPGTSGAPLVTVVPDPAAWTASETPYDFREGLGQLKPGRSIVRGMAIRRERFFSHSSFVTAREIKELLDGYLNGTLKPPRPGVDIEIKWKAQDALLYRVDPLRNLRETIAYASATAGGTISDAGNGVFVDGGDIATLAEDSPKDFLGKVSAFPAYGDSPQVYWMFMMRHPTTSYLINFWCWFDMEFYPMLARFTFGTRQTEGPHMDLVSQLGPRFGQKGEYEIKTPQYVKVDKSGVLIRIKTEDGDSIEVQLNREGVICENGACPEHFAPVIEAKSASGQTYIVDLHQFFFADTSKSAVPEFRDPNLQSLDEKTYYKIIYDRLQAEVQKPRIMYRKKRADPSTAMKLEQGLVTTVEWDCEARLERKKP